MTRLLQKNENENIHDNVNIHDNILMNIYIILRIGNFYGLLFIVTMTLDKLNTFLFPDIFTTDELYL